MIQQKLRAEYNHILYEYFDVLNDIDRVYKLRFKSVYYRNKLKSLEAKKEQLSKELKELDNKIDNLN